MQSFLFCLQPHFTLHLDHVLLICPLLFVPYSESRLCAIHKRNQSAHTPPPLEGQTFLGKMK